MLALCLHCCCEDILNIGLYFSAGAGAVSVTLGWSILSSCYPYCSACVYDVGLTSQCDRIDVILNIDPLLVLLS